MDVQSLVGYTIIVAEDGRELGRVLEAKTNKDGCLTLKMSISTNSLPAISPLFQPPMGAK